MKKSANINSTEWCDMIFDGKNKEYGAYKLRQTATKRYLVAFGAMCIFVGAIIAIPAVAGKVNENRAKSEGIDDTYTLIEIDKPLNNVEEVVKPEIPEVPTEKFVDMAKFTQIAIVDDDMMDADNTLKAMQDLSKSKAAIGNFQVDNGSVDMDAVRKEMANAHKVMGTEKTDNAGPIRIAEIMPAFPGGESELYAYISKHLKYPVTEQEIGTQGRVTVQFVVSKDGTIRDVKIVRGISPACDKEAVKVVRSMPKWIPGRQNGVAVHVYFTLPIVFKLT